MDFESYKAEVVAKAREALKNEPWFRGVCTDTIYADYNTETPIEEAVETVIDTTTYWDKK